LSSTTVVRLAIAWPAALAVSSAGLFLAGKKPFGAILAFFALAFALALVDEERRTLAARSWRKRVAELDARVRQTRLHQQLDLHQAVRLKDAEADSLV